MEQFLKALTGSADLQGAYVANAAVAILGLLWVAGIAATGRDREAWRGWLIFWVGTASFYVLQLALLKVLDLWWLPRLGLYLATAALLASYGAVAYPGKLSSGVPLASSAGCVLLTALADYWAVRHHGHAGWHQALTGLSLMLWAWRLRVSDASKSLVIAGYALVQLPLQPLMVAASISTDAPYESFVASTYAIYALLKFGLIPPVCAVIQLPRPQPRSVVDPSPIE